MEKFKRTKRNKQKKFEPYWYRKKTPGLVSDSDLDKILTRGHKETMKLWSHLNEAKMQKVDCNIVKKQYKRFMRHLKFYTKLLEQKSCKKHKKERRAGKIKKIEKRKFADVDDDLNQSIANCQVPTPTTGKSLKVKRSKFNDYDHDPAQQIVDSSAQESMRSEQTSSSGNNERVRSKTVKST